MRLADIETEKIREARQAEERKLARAAVDLHAIDQSCGVLICPVCRFRRLHYTVSVNGKVWLSCLTAGCVEEIDP